MREGVCRSDLHSEADRLESTGEEIGVRRFYKLGEGV